MKRVLRSALPKAQLVTSSTGTGRNEEVAFGWECGDAALGLLVGFVGIVESAGGDEAGDVVGFAEGAVGDFVEGDEAESEELAFGREAVDAAFDFVAGFVGLVESA